MSKSPNPKVLFILHVPPPMHGAAVVGESIRKSIFINNEIDGQYINLSTSRNFDELRRGSFKKVITFIRLMKEIIVILSKNKFDFCYISLTAKGLGFYKDFLIVLLLKILGNKILYHMHNKGVAEASKVWYKNLLFRITFKNTKSILLSKNLHQDVKMHVAETDVYYCSNGIEPKLSLQKPQKHNETLKISQLLFLSNMMFEKGVYVLIDALNVLKQKGVKFECDFVGAWSDISEEVFDSKIKAYNLQDCVRAHGPKYAVDKNIYFQNADIFIFPTLNETFGLVNLEAMQYSLPIVSTTEGGIIDIVKDGESGYLVNHGDFISLAKKLEILINNPEMRIKMGNNGLKRFEELFTFQKFEENFVKILKNYCASLKLT